MNLTNGGQLGTPRLCHDAGVRSTSRSRWLQSTELDSILWEIEYLRYYRRLGLDCVRLINYIFPIPSSNTGLSSTPYLVYVVTSYRELPTGNNHY